MATENTRIIFDGYADKGWEPAMVKDQDFDGQEKRGNNEGRRWTDAHVCIFHDDDKRRAEACMAHIKDKVAKNEEKTDGFIKRLHDRIDNTVSFKAAGLVTTVAIALLIAVLGMSKAQLTKVHEEIKKVAASTVALHSQMDASLIEGVRVGTIQQNVVKKLDKVSSRQSAFGVDIETIKRRLMIMSRNACGDESGPTDVEPYDYE